MLGPGMRIGSWHVLAFVLALLLAGLAGCADPDQPEGPDSDEDGTDGVEQTPRKTIAWNRIPSPEEVPEPDPEALEELVDRQVYENKTAREPRYRTPGTEGHEAAIPILEEVLNATGARVETEAFTVELPRLGEVEATNVYGVREGIDDDREIWLAAHWDSRAWADQARNETRRDEPVLGANDGAAAVAVVTHVLGLLPETDATVKVALFDVEDQGRQGEGWIEGSTHAAEQLGDDELARIEAFLLVDMPGHTELSVPREGRSDDQAPDLTDLTFGVAERLGAPSFSNETAGPVIDDHVPFLDRGTPAVDLIHLDDNGTTAFPWTWHTPHDTPEHISEASMAEVTRVVAGTAMAVDRGALPPQTG